jgi:hypothetical protein
MWAICLRSVSSGYHAEFHEDCYQKHTNQLNCRTSSSDISGYNADFHEGHGSVGERQENCMDAARALYDMCELAVALQGDTCQYLLSGDGLENERVLLRLTGQFGILKIKLTFPWGTRAKNLTESRKSLNLY